MNKPYAARTHEKMLEVLMDKKANGPEIHYYMIRGGSEKTNITVWEAGTVGKTWNSGVCNISDEYIKTYGHYHVGHLDETYKVLSGEGIVILQTRKIGVDGIPIDDEIERFEAHFVKAGDSVFIPSGTGHFAINTGSTWFVTSDDSPVNFDEVDPVSLPGHADYEPFGRLHGGAYYVVMGTDGRPTFKKNPDYKEVPDVIIK